MKNINNNRKTEVINSMKTSVMEYRAKLDGEVRRKMNVCRNEVFEAIELAADSLGGVAHNRVLALQEQVDERIDSLIKEVSEAI